MTKAEYLLDRHGTPTDPRRPHIAPLFPNNPNPTANIQLSQPPLSNQLKRLRSPLSDRTEKETRNQPPPQNTEEHKTSDSDSENLIIQKTWQSIRSSKKRRIKELSDSEELENPKTPNIPPRHKKRTPTLTLENPRKKLSLTQFHRRTERTPKENNTKKNHAKTTTPKQKPLQDYFPSLAQPNDPQLNLNGPKSTLNILQWNAHVLTEDKMKALTDYCKTENIDILLISELGHRRKIDNFRTAAISDLHTQQGIFIAKQYSNMIENRKDISTQLQTFDHSIMTTAIELKNTNLVIIHPYIHPNTSTEIRNEYWKTIHEITENEKQKQIIISGDLNTKDPWFHPDHKEKHHKELRKMIERLNMQILNDGSTTRYQSKSALDVTIVNQEASKHVKLWKTGEHLGSDHLPTITKTSIGIPKREGDTKITETINVLNIKKTLQKMTKAINITPIDTIQDLMTLIEETKELEQIKHTPKDWWNDDLRKKVNEINKWKRKKSQIGENSPRKNEVHTKLVEIEREFKHLKEKAKRLHARELIMEAAKDKTGQELYKTAKHLQPGLNKKKKTYITNTIRAKTAVEDISSGFRATNNSPDLPHKEENIKVDIPEQKVPIPEVTNYELTYAVKKAKAHGAPGIDGLKYRFFKELIKVPKLKETLRKAINNMIQSGHFDATLKIAKIAPILKPNKKDYRPISLLKVVAKIAERIIEQRLRDEISTLLKKNQFGCKPGHSTAQAISRILHANAMAAKERGPSSFGLMTFDFSKAYDRVPAKLLIQKLIDTKKTSPYLIKIIHSWLTDRQAIVYHRGEISAPFESYNGIPQGSALSVLLWLIFINDIPVNENTSNLYVDDTAIWAYGSTPTEVTAILQEQARQIEDWCQNNMVLINYTKTEFVLTWNDQLTELHKVHLNGKTITAKEEIKYLGVTLKSLNTSTHYSRMLLIDLETPAGDIIRKCNLLYRLRKLGLDHHGLKLITNSFILGKLRYYLPFLGAEIHQNHLEYPNGPNPTKDLLRPLRTALNHVMRTITGAYRSTPIPLLVAATNLLPLEEMIKEAALKMMTRAISTNNIIGLEYRDWTHDGSGDGLSPYGIILQNLENIISTEIYSTFPENTRPTLYTRIQFSQAKFIIMDTKAEAMVAYLNDTLIPKDTTLQVWTDASYKQNHDIAGGGILIERKGKHPTEHSVLMKNIHNSYDAERTTILEALKRTASRTRRHDKVAILTDSQSNLKHLQSIQLVPQAIDEVTTAIIDKSIDILKKGAQLTFIFTPGHKGIPQNEYVDQLATQSYQRMEKQHELHEVHILHYNYTTPIQTMIRQHVRRRRDTYLKKHIKERSKVNPTYPNRLPFIEGIPIWKPNDPQPEIYKPYLKEPLHKGLFRLRTGHTNTRTHKARLKRHAGKHDKLNATEDNCQYCHSPNGTPEHIILYCTSINPNSTLLQARKKHIEKGIPFNDSLWTTNPVEHKELLSLLDAAEAAGLHW